MAPFAASNVAFACVKDEKRSLAVPLYDLLSTTYSTLYITSKYVVHECLPLLTCDVMMSPDTTVASVKRYDEVSPTILEANTPTKKNAIPMIPDTMLPNVALNLHYLEIASFIYILEHFIGISKTPKS